MTVRVRVPTLLRPAVEGAAAVEVAAGTVGERFDGYAAVRDSGAPADIRNLVAEINAKRTQVYEGRAASEGVSVGQVGRVYAKQIFAAAPGGTWFLLESGEWVQK